MTANTMIAEKAARIEAAPFGLQAVDSAAAGLTQLRTALAQGALRAAFDDAAALMLASHGRLIVTGVGKSGHIGVKLAATFASTGTPAHFVHAAEASHGDLGMIGRNDVVLALSWSGETRELSDVVAHARRFKTPLIALTGVGDSMLTRAADVTLALPRAAEACPHNLAPTTSTTLQLALGDALAVAVLRLRGFSAADFRDVHPGGKLGEKLKPVSALMTPSPHMPLVGPEATMNDAVATITSKAFGIVGVLDGDGRLTGVLTDGDVRRFVEANADRTVRAALARPAVDVMTHAPIVAPPDMLAASAVALMEERRISALFVVRDGRPVGVVTLLQFLRSGVA